MPIDYTTPAGRVRLLAADTAADTLGEQLFTDDQIDAFLVLEGGDVRLAAAQALDTVASSKALLARKAKIGNLSVDETTSARELSARASALRKQAAEAGSDPTISPIDIVDYDPNAWLYSE